MFDRDIDPVSAVMHLAEGRSYSFTKIKQQITLNFLQESVGGNIEMIILNKHKILIINEDGKTKELQYNKNATALFRLNFPESEDVILGDAILMESKDIL